MNTRDSWQFTSCHKDKFGVKLCMAAVALCIFSHVNNLLTLKMKTLSPESADLPFILIGSNSSAVNPSTLPETNTAPDNQWLEDEISFWDGLILYEPI